MQIPLAMTKNISSMQNKLADPIKINFLLTFLCHDSYDIHIRLEKLDSLFPGSYGACSTCVIR